MACTSPVSSTHRLWSIVLSCLRRYVNTKPHHCLLTTLNPQALSLDWTVTLSALMHTFTHTVHSDEWSPWASAVKLRPLHYFSTVALHTCSLISFPALWDLSQPHLFPILSLMQHPGCCRSLFPLTSSPRSPFKTPSLTHPVPSFFDSCTVAHLLSLSLQEASANKFKRNQSDIWTWTKDSSLWVHLPSGEATVYTWWCA